MALLLKRLGRRIARELDNMRPKSIAWKAKCRKGTLQPIITPLGNKLKVRIWTQDVIGRNIYVHGCFEPEMYRFVSHFLKPGMVFIDAGTNLGQYTVLAAQQVGATGHVHSFEPNPRMFGELQFNVGLNNFQERCILNELALSDSCGMAKLSRYEQGKEVYGSLGTHKREGGEIVGYDEVEMTTLDAYIEERSLSHVDLIKMDIEGAELPALKGTRKLLSRPSPPTIAIEVADENTKGFGYKATDIWDYLESFRYEMFLIDRKGRTINKADKPADFIKAQNLVAKKIAA